MSGWIGFNTAVSGLLASQRSLYTVNHNISNINTEGYSRQTTVQGASSAFNLPGIGLLGAGTEITEINRVRDSYMNFKFWNESAPTGEWKAKQSSLSELEYLFNEPSDEAIRKNMDELFSALESLSGNPSDYSNRALVSEKANAFTKQLNETAKKLYNTQSELNFEVSTKIKQVNDYGEQIKNLNEQIFKLELDGTAANDLRDKRDLALDKLSKIVDIKVSESQGQLRVSIGGIGLVDHVTTSKLKYPPNVVENPLNPKEKLVQVQWETGDQPVSLSGGELKGLLDVRDGDGTAGSYRGIPFYINKMDEFAQKIFEKINEVHYSGYGKDGESGKFFFSINGKDTDELGISSVGDDDYKDFIKNNVTAFNISISGDILGNLDNIAAASNTNGAENNENILEIIALREDKTFFDTTSPQGTPDDFFKSILSSLAVDSQQSKRMDGNQKSIMTSIETRRESESGVLADEEMSNMVKFQHAYNASARMITTMDEIFDVMINRLGMVGR